MGTIIVRMAKSHQAQRPVAGHDFEIEFTEKMDENDELWNLAV